jgi:DNA-binding transcriptional LysR family regulator
MQPDSRIRVVIDIGEIEAFLTVAEEHHFGRAAQRLVLSPSRISQLIRRLEGRVGAPLFQRTTRRVQLTPLGAALHADLSKAYAELGSALRRAQATAHAVEGTLRVGYLTHADDEAFVKLAARFGERHPACTITTVDITGSRYFDLLRSGEVDVALGRFGPHLPDDLVAGPVMSSEPWVLGVARDHPLAGQTAVSVEELGRYPIFGVPDDLTGVLHNPLYPTTTPQGIPLSYQGIARTLAEVLSLVAAGENVFPTSASFPNYYGHPDVRFVPMYGWPPVTRILVWRRGADGKVAALAQLASEPDAAATPEPGP